MFLFESIFQDIRYAVRMIRSSPGFTVVAILSLGLGIGATTAIFSVMDALMLKPLPVMNPDQLVELPRSDGPNVYTHSVWKQIENQQDILSSVFAYGDTRFDLVDGGEKQSINGLYVSGEYFNALGVPPILGRTITDSDDQPGAPLVCVISYGLWQRRYGLSPSVIGQNIPIDGSAVEVVGVAPRRFFGIDVGETFDLIMPLESERRLNPKGSALDDLNAWWLRVAGRLKPGVGVSQTTARLRVLGPAIFKASLPPEAAKVWRSPLTLVASPIRNGISDTRYVYGNTVLLMMVMAGVVLIIACTNLANLLLARSVTRQREIATRIALGASRSRLIRQLLTESIALSLAGAGIGLVVAHWGSTVLVSAISSSHYQTVLDLSWDWRLFSFTVFTTLCCALLFGLAPAVRAANLPIYTAMKGTSPIRKGRHRFSGAFLIVTQVSLSMVLVVSAGLLVRTLRALLTTDMGYESKGVLVVQSEPEGNEDWQRQAFLGDELLTGFRSVPGVISAARSNSSISHSMRPNVEIQMPGGLTTRYFSFLFFNSPDFFKTRHTPIFIGRDFTPQDSKASPPVAIISEYAAHVFFPGVNPIGLKYIELNGEKDGGIQSVEIVGIAKDINYRRPSDGPLLATYRPITQCVGSCPAIGRYELRFSGPLSETREGVKNSAANIDFHFALNFRLLSDESDEVVRRNRTNALVALLFGLLAGTLAMIGIYGVTSYATSQRTHEIGVRMTLGAQPSNVFGMIVGEAITLVVAGVALGAAVGLAVARAIRGMLYGVTPADPLTFTLAAGLMLLIAVIAAFLPAYRASKADPILALRVE